MDTEFIINRDELLSNGLALSHEKVPKQNTKFTVTGDLETHSTTSYDWMSEVNFTETKVYAKNIIENAL